jgi:hypothetical protein
VRPNMCAEVAEDHDHEFFWHPATWGSTNRLMVDSLEGCYSAQLYIQGLNLKVDKGKVRPFHRGGSTDEWSQVKEANMRPMRLTKSPHLLSWLLLSEVVSLATFGW